jgi:hypothetical protein
MGARSPAAAAHHRVPRESHRTALTPPRQHGAFDRERPVSVRGGPRLDDVPTMRPVNIEPRRALPGHSDLENHRLEQQQGAGKRRGHWIEAAWRTNRAAAALLDIGRPCLPPIAVSQPPCGRGGVCPARTCWRRPLAGAASAVTGKQIPRLHGCVDVARRSQCGHDRRTEPDATPYPESVTGRC